MQAVRSLLRSQELHTWLLVGVATVSAIWLAGVSGLDRALLERLAWPDKHPRSDLLMLLRIWGSIWTWSLIALAMGLQKQLSGAVRGVHARLAGLLLLAPPLLAGALAELIKLLVRRKRPSGLEIYLFKAWSDQPWSTKGLGLPSSHAAVAFAGSMTLALLYPRLALPALLVAIGCGYTRIASGSHYPSDVLAGAVVGVVTAAVIVPVLFPNRRRPWRSGRQQG
jgi:membrane-associated phospholipid phosphatase